VLASALLAGMAGALFLFAGHRDSAPVPSPTLRAMGTFHNPDHFADYLMLAFPFALAGGLSPHSFIRREWREPFAVFAALTAVVCLVGLMVSLSRGAWLAGLIGSAVFMFAGARRQAADQGERSRGRLMRYGALGGGLLFLLALAVAGTPATARIGTRLGETRHDTSMLDRFAVWRDSMTMVRDFPALGVGLGCWPEIFSRYDRAPWDPDLFWGETHNDYLQLLAEAGSIGLVLAGWILLSQGRALARARRTVSSRRLALVAAAIAAAAGAAVHELSDFSLQVPANALLLMVILGLAHRQAAHSQVHWWKAAPVGGGRVYAMGGAAAAAVLALFLIRWAARHDRLPYPDNLDAQMDAAQELDAPRAAARVTDLIRAYPAHAELHLTLAQLLLSQRLTDRARGELEIARWLQPANPQARDALAQVLFQSGDRREYLREITASVERSPRPSTHDYLEESAIPKLDAAEVDAVERGYRGALWNPDAVFGLGYFFKSLGRFSERGALYESAARRETGPARRWDYLLKAGESYIHAGNTTGAVNVLHQAAALRPESARPYRMLAMLYSAQRIYPRQHARSTMGSRRAPIPWN
jgi:O-antigen ligase